MKCKRKHVAFDIKIQTSKTPNNNFGPQQTYDIFMAKLIEIAFHHSAQFICFYANDTRIKIQLDQWYT